MRGNPDFEAWCIGGECPTSFDKLPPEALRVFEIRGMLFNLEPLGLAETVCNEYDIGPDDLTYLAFIEEELRELNKDKTDGGGTTPHNRV